MMKNHDHAALKLAVERYNRDGDYDQFNHIVKQHGWEGAAKFCARCMQGSALKLQPWEIPPAKINSPDNPDEGLRPDQPGPASDGRQQAAHLLKRMLAAGVSKWHPDPLRAIERAEARRAKTIAELAK
jgi:hypothetical protein